MEVIDEVVKACGIVIKTITGTEEAELTFRGVVGEAHTDSNPYMVIDIGGGSTELTREKSASWSTPSASTSDRYG